MEKSAMREYLEMARNLGFDHVYELDPGGLRVMEMVRDMCAQDKCHAYGHNWTCPPSCGTLEECQKKMAAYRQGILVQTTGYLTKRIDTKTYRETEKKHQDTFHKLADLVHAREPDALCLGSGGCRICKTCAYPAPCRFPERAVSSMEAYGLFVTQVCRDNGARYYYGDQTITYTACILFDYFEEAQRGEV